MSNRGTAAVAAALLASTTIVACGGGGNDAPNAGERSSTRMPPQPSSGAAPSKTPSSSGALPPSSGGTMNMDHSPIPGLTKVIDTGEIYRQSQQGIVFIYGRAPGVGRNALAGGTAFIHDLAGAMAITNAHVVGGLTGMKAVFSDGTVVPVHVMGQDPCSDLAVVHFPAMPKDTIRLPLGDSDAVRAGDTVTAMGYPQDASQDFTHSKLVPTTGQVQNPAISYDDNPDLSAFTAIQHGATIQHGNSGGPLTDNKGNVIGINTRGGPAETQGQYYAIPINSAHKAAEKLMTGENANNLGVQLQSLRTKKDPNTGHVHQYSEYFNKSVAADIESLLAKAGVQSGMIVASVQAGSPLDQKVFPYDLITELSNTSVDTMAQVCDILESKLPGKDTITITGYHLNPSDKQNFGRHFNISLKMPGTH